MTDTEDPQEVRPERLAQFAADLLSGRDPSEDGRRNVTHSNASEEDW